MTVSSIMSAKRVREYREAFAASGWNLHAKGVVGDVHDLDGPAFYLCDVNSGQLHVVATIKNVFDVVEEQKLKEGFTFQTICDAFGSIYTDICDGKIQADAEVSNLLAIAVSMYISGTQGYKFVVEQGRRDMHYIVIRHWDYASDTWMLRPVPIAPKPFYPPDVIECIVDEVLGIDRRNHPRRFKSADIISFKVRHRTECKGDPYDNGQSS